MDIRTAATKFITYIRDIKRYSKRTCEIYADALSSYISYILDEDSQQERTIPQLMTSTMLRNYEVYLLEHRNLSATTVNLQLSALSSFSKYLVSEGELEFDPVKRISRPKQKKRLPSFYKQSSMDEYFQRTDEWASKETLDLLLEHLDNSREEEARALYIERLDRLIVNILYSTGIRRAELISLDDGNLDFSRKLLKVTGKGDKMREIPLVSSLFNEISLYLIARNSMFGCDKDSNSPLLLTGNGKRLYPVYIDRAVKSELGLVDSITGRKSPHVLRHTLATELLNNGTDLNSIKELLGHSSLAATQIYTHNSIEKLKNVYESAHPRAKIGGKHGR